MDLKLNRINLFQVHSFECKIMRRDIGGNGVSQSPELFHDLNSSNVLIYLDHSHLRIMITFH